MNAIYGKCARIVAVLFLGTAAPLCADEKLKDIACRSVHLSYPAPDGVAFYNEVAVEKSAVGSYFMVCRKCVGTPGT